MRLLFGNKVFRIIYQLQNVFSLLIELVLVYIEVIYPFQLISTNLWKKVHQL